MYLEKAPSTIVSAISSDISGLSATVDFNGDCFGPPSAGISYQAGLATLGAFDLVTSAARPTLAFVRDFIADVGAKVPTNFAAAAGSFFDALTPTPRTTNLPGSHTIVGALYGSSVTEKNLREFGLLEDQGGAVALAAQEPSVPEPESGPETVNDTQEGVVLGAEAESPAPPPPPAPEVVGVPPLFPIGGGGSAGFGGEAGPAHPIEVAVAESVSVEVATSAASTTPPEDTPAPPADEVPPSVSLYSQLTFSTLGDPASMHPNSLPIQKLGTGLSGAVGSVAYRLNGADIASEIGVEKFGEVQLFFCPSGSYTSCSKRADSAFNPQILSQSGNDATILVDMTGSVYSFDPGFYYYLLWDIRGDYAVYGSFEDTYTGGIAQWNGNTNDVSATADTQIADIAFNLCSGASCVLP